MNPEIYEKDLIKLLNRIDKVNGRFISCNRGWYRILVDTDEMLSHIDPDYKILQVKEKFGTLRFYWSTHFDTDTTEHKIMNVIVENAERKSSYTCDDCGNSRYGIYNSLDNSVTMRKHEGHVRTLCSKCSSLRENNPVD